MRTNGRIGLEIRFAAELVALLAGSDTMPVLRRLHPLPAGQPLESDVRCHPSRRRNPPRPPNHKGANLAMPDGAELGRTIAVHHDDAETALTVYEQSVVCSFCRLYGPCATGRARSARSSSGSSANRSCIACRGRRRPRSGRCRRRGAQPARRGGPAGPARGNLTGRGRARGHRKQGYRVAPVALVGRVRRRPLSWR